MNVIAYTQKGIQKQENEDRIVIGDTVLSQGAFETLFDTGILAIADGVGGRTAGATASQFVAEKLSSLSEVTHDRIASINRELLVFSQTLPSQHGMATTASGVCIGNDQTVVFSVGNTRVYRLQSQRYLKQLTTDDTLVNFLLASGRLSPSQAADFDRKNEITACFGGGDPALFRISIDTLPVSPAPFMITSDGIHDHLSVDEIEEIIAAHGFTKRTCEVCVETARQNGSCDDASILFAW